MRSDDNTLAALQRRGDIVAARYVLGDVIGLGGMGVVYAATQCGLERTVALKMPRPELASNPSIAARFRAEARAGSRTNHRNVVRVFDFGEQDGTPYLVMEHVAGIRLGEYAEPLGLGAALAIISQVLAGLDDMHANLVVHGDVKSDNIMVETLRDGTLYPRLIDFGLACVLDRASDPELGVAGTPEYLSPELVRGEAPSTASDVYAAGITLYELISGDTPFGGGSPDDIMRRQLAEEPVPLAWRCNDRRIPPALDEVMSRALAKAPAQRYATAGELRDALAHAVSATELASAPAVSPVVAFSTECDTAPMAVDGVAIARTSTLGDRRDAVASALDTREPGPIVVAYLDLARALIDMHDLRAAAVELEFGTALLVGTLGPCGRAAAWRLMLTLAAVHDGLGARARAVEVARRARDFAARAGSPVGQDRADQLLRRLSHDRRRSA